MIGSPAHQVVSWLNRQATEKKRNAMISLNRSHKQVSQSKSKRGFLAGLLIALSVSALPASVSAQYFGRNKVQYETFDFRILKTPNYDIHFYPEEADAVEDAARMGERWYERFARLFQH